MSLSPAKLSYTIWRGATFSSSLTLYTDANQTELWDLTGYSATLEIKDAPDHPGDEQTPNVLLTLDTGVNGGITLGGADGTIDITISATDTAAIEWQVGHYDLVITAADDTADALTFGTFKVRGV